MANGTMIYINWESMAGRRHMVVLVKTIKQLCVLTLYSEKVNFHIDNVRMNTQYDMHASSRCWTEHWTNYLAVGNDWYAMTGMQWLVRNDWYAMTGTQWKSEVETQWAEARCFITWVKNLRRNGRLQYFTADSNEKIDQNNYCPGMVRISFLKKKKYSWKLVQYVQYVHACCVSCGIQYVNDRATKWEHAGKTIVLLLYSVQIWWDKQSGLYSVYT